MGGTVFQDVGIEPFLFSLELRIWHFNCSISGFNYIRTRDVIRDSLILIFVIQATTRSTPLENRQVFTFEFESVSLRNELDTTLCDKVCQ